MPTLSITKAPTYTLSIQLYARTGGAAVGGIRPLTEIGTGGLYQCTVPDGDYDCQLLGFSVPDGPRFPVRDGVAYEFVPWSIIDNQRFISAPTFGESGNDTTTNEIVAPTDADLVIVRSVIDLNGAPVALPPCYFAITDANEVLISTLTPVISGSTYNVTIPRAISTAQRTISFALRSTSDGNFAIDSGTIRYAFVATE